MQLAMGFACDSATIPETNMLDAILIASLKARVQELQSQTGASTDKNASNLQSYDKLMKQTRRAICCCKPEEVWLQES
jgi:hypothetical protein